jgi:hypothetical protein
MDALLTLGLLAYSIAPIARARVQDEPGLSGDGEDLADGPGRRPDGGLGRVAGARISAERQLPFWDAMIVRSAEQLGCQTLWTEDLDAGQIINGVRVANPFA